MRVVLVPNVLRDAIYARIDAALKYAPADAMLDREALYSQLLEAYDNLGYLPEFEIEKR